MTNLVMDPEEARASASPQSVSTRWTRQQDVLDVRGVGGRARVRRGSYEHWRSAQLLLGAAE